jgi:hypothetical protein
MEAEYIIKYIFTSYTLSEKQVVLSFWALFVKKKCIAKRLYLAKQNVQLYRSVVICVYRSYTWLFSSYIMWRINKSNYLTPQSRELLENLIRVVPQVVYKIFAIYGTQRFLFTTACHWFLYIFTK